MVATLTGKTLILGLGNTGLSCVRFLSQNNIPLMVMDTRTNPPGLQELQQEFPEIPVFLGGLQREVLDQAQEIVISPGLALNQPLIQEQLQKNKSIVGDIEIFARYVQAPVCAITGSNAKSTVTTLVGEMAKTAGLKVSVGGNLGPPALDLLKTPVTDLFVLELSSFQLETTYSLQPKAATILNITPDHMDRYADVREYVNAKQRIYNGAETVIVNSEDPLTWPADTASKKIIRFGSNPPQGQDFGLIQTADGTFLAYGNERLIAASDLKIQGSHNWLNALAALALGTALNIPLKAMLKTLETFAGLPHRCQWVRELHQVNWYNDSKGTNVGATLAAIQGLGAAVSGKLILIAGGQGKGADFTPLKPAIQQSVRQLILIGEDAAIIGKTMNGVCDIIYANDLQAAIHQAQKTAIAGDAVLLSPACASFDMFKNFEHRGEVFMDMVRKLS